MNSSKSPRVSIVSAVVCDDIRHEDNGKDILIGVYSGIITVHALPSPSIPLRCWLSIEAQGSGNAKLDFQVSDHKNSQIFQTEINMGSDELVGYGRIPLGPILYSLKDPEGHLKFDYKVEGGEWINIITKNIRYQSKWILVYSTATCHASAP